MQNIYLKKALRLYVRYNIVCLIVCIAIAGCSSRKLPLSVAARSFKQEVQEKIKQLSPIFIEPLARKDAKTVKSLLEKTVSDAAKESKPLKLIIAILDDQGVKVAGSYSDVPMNFSGYDVVQQIINKQQTVTGELYRGAERFLFIGAPLMHRGQMVGILVLGNSQEALKKQWNVSAEEVLALDFNS
ncbi:MAG: hypothetical protein L7F78_10535 [Syntrophales bacterium LBB04]|nr:hypothetical protein [Syntrophales bacterium LBB04]